MAREKEIYKIYHEAREISGSVGWKTILTTMDKRVKFEDGYVAGWFAHKRYMASKKQRDRKKINGRVK